MVKIKPNTEVKHTLDRRPNHVLREPRPQLIRGEGEGRGGAVGARHLDLHHVGVAGDNGDRVVVPDLEM